MTLTFDSATRIGGRGLRDVWLMRSGSVDREQSSTAQRAVASPIFRGWYNSGVISEVCALSVSLYTAMP
ncbi:hypothetical protein BaRGS_00018780, partial [Batillaria attramentaria]